MVQAQHQQMRRLLYSGLICEFSFTCYDKKGVRISRPFLLMTQSHKYLLVIFLFCAFSTAAHALPVKNETHLALSLMDFGYKEFDDDDDLLNREDGLLPGISLSIVKPVRRLLMTGELSFYVNDVLYQGQTQSGIPVDSRTDTFIYDFSLSITHILVGKSLLPERIYYGIGYRHWDRNIRDTETDAGIPVMGIHEVYRLPYVLLGSRWNFVRSDNFSGSFNFRITHTVASEMFVNLYEGTTLDLGEKFGGRASIMFTSISSMRKNYFVEPFYEFWQIGKSDTEYNSGVGYIYEPRSTTNNLGINIGMQW